MLNSPQLFFPIVSIVGRPNVGKSTLFNRILRRRKAIIDKKSGVTRDRISALAEWNGFKFVIIDTGGIVIGNKNELTQKVLSQVMKAVDESHLIIFLCNGKEGLVNLDEGIASILRETNKPVLLAINKIDNEKLEEILYEFYKLGLGEPIPISAIHGKGIDLLLDSTIDFIEDLDLSKRDSDIKNVIKIAIIGRPNVGKSSFLNALLGENRVIVHDKPQTTRDAIDTFLNYKNKNFILIDTAGLRHKSKIKNSLQFYSSLRTERAIESCDVCFVLIDGWEGLKKDDIRILYSAWGKGKGVILLINKKDLIKTPLEIYQQLIKDKLPIADRIPIIYISAKTKENIKKTLIVATQVYENLNLRISTSKVNQLFDEIKSEINRLTGGNEIKIFYSAQMSINPIKFHIIVNKIVNISPQVKNYIENKIRVKFGFLGCPIELIFKKRRRKK